MIYNYCSYSRPRNVVDFISGDVNGDNIWDNIYLTGRKSSDSPLVKDIQLIIQDGDTDIFYCIPLKDNIGYDPKLLLADFTGDGINDILISIATGGSGGIYIYYIYSFAYNTVRMIFDYEEYNNQYKYDVVYKDDYRVEVDSFINKEKYLIDLSLRDSDYLNEIYDNNGNLIQPISGWVDPLSGLYPIDFDSDKVYELLGFQKISGKYHADSLGFVQNTLKWDNHNFVLDRQVISIFGNEFI